MTRLQSKTGDEVASRRLLLIFYFQIVLYWYKLIDELFDLEAEVDHWFDLLVVITVTLMVLLGGIALALAFGWAFHHVKEKVQSNYVRLVLTIPALVLMLTPPLLFLSAEDWATIPMLQTTGDLFFSASVSGFFYGATLLLVTERKAKRNE